ncbi:MAG: hypothetical protein EZS28_027967, partial [Streblomastix strix]
LQEIRDIASGKSNAHVFSTQKELNNWQSIQDYVANLAIGNNLYIVDKKVNDYWCDGTDFKILETELLDMINVISTLGAATGGDMAITDISISGNTLTLAKNTIFITTDYDQNTNGSKTFISTIHSIGISVQNYDNNNDNNNDDLAGGGVRAISDITVIIELRNYYNKSQAYLQTDINNLLNKKAKIGDSYTKGEDDLLLFAKAGNIKLIDSYQKTQTYNLLNQNANSGDSCIYGEDNILLVTNADKTQQIDSYIKTEIDQLMLQIEVGDVDLNNYYTKTKTDELLEGKVGIKFISAFGAIYDETQDSVANTYLTISKTFTSNINATDFVKAGKNNTSVLLGGGGDVLLSSFGGLELVNITYTYNEVSLTQIVVEKCFREGYLINFYAEIYMGAGTGTSCASVAVCILDNAGFPKYVVQADDIIFAGSPSLVAHISLFRFGTDGKVKIYIFIKWWCRWVSWQPNSIYQRQISCLRLITKQFDSQNLSNKTIRIILDRQ